MTERMIINIELDEDIISKVQRQADQEKRSRKQMIELIVERSFTK